MSSTPRFASRPPPGREPVDVFAAERPRLLGLAYRLLGSLSDAEDVVQEAWLHFDRADAASIESPEAWLTTVVSRRGLDRLRARQRERADYVGPWLPEPIGGPVEQPSADTVDPADHAVMADSLTTAFLVMLETLSPEERLAVVLADVFAVPFASIAAVLDRSEPAARQMASRARRKLRDADPAVAEGRPAAPRDQQAVATRFVTALVSGDLVGAAELLAPDVVLLSDGGAAIRAARQAVVGRDRVARLVGNVTRDFDRYGVLSACIVNRRPAVVTHRDGRATFVAVFEVVDGLVHRIHVVINPDKLAFVDDAAPLC